MLSFPLDFVVIGMASFDAGALSLVRSLSRSTWLARLDGALVVARAVTDPPADEVEPFPLLVPVLGTADLDGTTWLVSEHVDGVSGQRLLGLATLTSAQAAYLAARTLAALAALHAAGRAHGRLHAGNVLVARDGSVRLSDWALTPDATPAADLAAVREFVAALVRNADRPAARHGELLDRLERLAAAPIADPAVAVRELEQSVSDSVPSELGNLVGATHRTAPTGVPAAAPLPDRLPHIRRPPPRRFPQRRWVAVGATLLVLAAVGGAALAVSHRRHEASPPSSPARPHTSAPPNRPAPRSTTPTAPTAPTAPAAAIAVAPRSAGFVNGVAITPVETCQPGATCSVTVTIKITAHDDLKRVTWTFVLVDACTGARTNLAGGSMTAQPNWQHIYATTTVPLPKSRAVALVAMTTAPVRAASAPLTVPSGHAQC